MFLAERCRRFVFTQGEIPVPRRKASAGRNPVLLRMKGKSREMKNGFLIDMDGVVYRGKTVIPGACEFINTLVDRKIPFTFFTNNSQRTRRDTTIKMNRLGFNITEKQLIYFQ